MNLQNQLRKNINFFKLFGLYNLKPTSKNQTAYPEYTTSIWQNLSSLTVIILVITMGAIQIAFNTDRSNLTLSIGAYAVDIGNTVGLTMVIIHRMFQQKQICHLVNNLMKMIHDVTVVTKIDSKVNFKGYIFSIVAYGAGVMLYDSPYWDILYLSDYIAMILQFAICSQFGTLAIMVAQMYKNLRKGLVAVLNNGKFYLELENSLDFERNIFKALPSGTKVFM